MRRRPYTPTIHASTKRTLPYILSTQSPMINVLASILPLLTVNSCRHRRSQKRLLARVCLTSSAPCTRSSVCSVSAERQGGHPYKKSRAHPPQRVPILRGRPGRVLSAQAKRPHVLHCLCCCFLSCHRASCSLPTCQACRHPYWLYRGTAIGKLLGATTEQRHQTQNKCAVAEPSPAAETVVEARGRQNCRLATSDSGSGESREQTGRSSKWKAFRARPYCLVNYGKQRGRYDGGREMREEEGDEETDARESNIRILERRDYRMMGINSDAFDVYKNVLKASIRRVKSYMKVYH